MGTSLPINLCKQNSFIAGKFTVEFKTQDLDLFHILADLTTGVFQRQCLLTGVYTQQYVVCVVVAVGYKLLAPALVECQKCYHLI